MDRFASFHDNPTDIYFTGQPKKENGTRIEYRHVPDTILSPQL